MTGSHDALQKPDRCAHFALQTKKILLPNASLSMRVPEYCCEFGTVLTDLDGKEAGGPMIGPDGAAVYCVDCTTVRFDTTCHPALVAARLTDASADGSPLRWNDSLNLAVRMLERAHLVVARAETLCLYSEKVRRNARSIRAMRQPRGVCLGAWG